MKEKDHPQNGKNPYKDTHREFISNTSMNNLMVQYQEINNPIKESAKDLNSHFSKEGIEMAIKHKKGYSASLVLRERQFSCPMRYHFTSIRITISKNLQ